MLRGILIVVLVIAVCVGGWMFYKQYNGSTSLGSGDVALRSTPAAKDNSDAAYTDLDGSKVTKAAPEQQTTTYDQAAPPPADQNAAAVGSGTQITGPAPVPQDQVQAPHSSSMVAPSAPLPVSDTIAPNPPNGAVFTGSGKYQWYRQGNLTWRVNSGSGAACIAFATMQEWQKPLVYTHGCGNA